MQKIANMRSPHHEEALLLGMIDHFLAHYTVEWAEAMKKSTKTAKRWVGSPKHWPALRKIAANIIELGVPVEKFLKIAAEVKPKTLKISTLQHLAGPMFFERVVNWAAPDERVEKNNGYPEGFELVKYGPGELKAQTRAMEEDPTYNDVPGEDLEDALARLDAYECKKGARG